MITNLLAFIDKESSSFLDSLNWQSYNDNALSFCHSLVNFFDILGGTTDTKMFFLFGIFVAYFLLIITSLFLYIDQILKGAFLWLDLVFDRWCG